MKKTSKTARITMLLVVLCLISTAMLSGTFAKYTSEFAGEDTALIAKWDISVTDGEDNVLGGVQSLDLFKHAFNQNIITGAGTDKIIAPGVSGDFTLKVENIGDVAAEVVFDLAASGSANDVPIEYSIDGSSWVNLGDLETALNSLAGMQNVAAGTGTAEQKVEWRWQFERGEDAALTANDAADTLLGTTSVTDNRSTYILTVTATATQIAPAL
jgi:hypothetical protein